MKVQNIATIAHLHVLFHRIFLASGKKVKSKIIYTRTIATVKCMKGNVFIASNWIEG